MRNYVRKPLMAREGANITLVRDNATIVSDSSVDIKSLTKVTTQVNAIAAALGNMGSGVSIAVGYGQAMSDVEANVGGTTNITNAQFGSKFGLFDTIARFDWDTGNAKYPVTFIGDYVQNTRACANVSNIQHPPANTASRRDGRSRPPATDRSRIT